MNRTSPTIFAILLLAVIFLFNSLSVALFNWFIPTWGCLMVWSVFSILYGVEWALRRASKPGSARSITPIYRNYG